MRFGVLFALSGVQVTAPGPVERLREAAEILGGYNCGCMPLQEGERCYQCDAIIDLRGALSALTPEAARRADEALGTWRVVGTALRVRCDGSVHYHDGISPTCDCEMAKRAAGRG